MSTDKTSRTYFSSSVSWTSTLVSVSLTGLIKVMIFMRREVVKRGKDFCLTTFYSLFNKKVNLFAVLEDKYRNLPTFYKAKMSSSILCPFKSSIRLCKHVIIFSGSMILNLVNSHKYFQLRFFLSVTIKAVPTFSLIFSYSLKRL